MESTVRGPLQMGQAIKRWRIQSGLTQMQLAKKASLLQKTISQVERGSKTVEAATLFAICAALNLEFIVRERPKAVNWSKKEVFGG